jgi:hypothetical protein
MKTPLVATFFSGGLCSEESWRISAYGIKRKNSMSRQTSAHDPQGHPGGVTITSGKVELWGLACYTLASRRCCFASRANTHFKVWVQVRSSRSFSRLPQLRWPTRDQSLYDCALKQGILQD